MKLLDVENGSRKEWEEKGYELPAYDREAVKIFMLRSMRTIP